MAEYYNHTDPNTGTVTYDGPSEITKASHRHMTARTDAYEPDDQKGHLQASALGGNNSRYNVVPQNGDVNHGSYLAMENGEMDALRSGASIHSNKAAFVSNQDGARPDAFMVNDTVTYADGHTEAIHSSFQNNSYDLQESWNSASAALSDTFEGNNPGDSLRDSMSASQYADLMEETDAALPDIQQDYAPADSFVSFGGDTAPDTDAPSLGADSFSASAADEPAADAEAPSLEADMADAGEAEAGPASGDDGPEPDDE